jgi:AcrR family transcriptional regulator
MVENAYRGVVISPPGVERASMDLVAKQREERMRRILDVARKLITDRGYDGVTMRELADASLVSVPTLYNLFGGKNELLFAAVESYFSDLLAGAAASNTAEGLERILSLARMLGRYTPRHAKHARSFMGFFGNVSDAGGIHEFVANQLTTQLQEGLDQMKAKRQLAAWADSGALAERLASQLSITMFEWARHQLSDAGLLSAMLYGTSVTLLGLSRGKAAQELEEIVRDNQGDASGRGPGLPRTAGDAPEELAEAVAEE